jgi:hypothetical protein
MFCRSVSPFVHFLLAIVVVCSSSIYGFWLPLWYLQTLLVTRLTRWVPLVKQELLTFPEHLSSPPVFSGVRVTRSLVLYVCFVDHCLSFCTFSFGHCVVCSSSIYGFWLTLWYLQALLKFLLPIKLYVTVRKHLLFLIKNCGFDNYYWFYFNIVMPT